MAAFHLFEEIFSLHILHLLEKKGGKERSISAMINFRMALNDCGLLDMSTLGPFPILHNKHGVGTYIEECLDNG